ncbi:MAG: glycogen debranching protein GlgX [Actinomyces ruminicola]|uniref:Glycogen operon protein n=1 Tax=Actinomyces ruminicola TaxID=332524 RepID=A0A1G9XRE0_9ACTO|nr:glycogen debranching protein GlgX [Actinomyces ruminicola]MBE6481712.1 glycogen debranching protein GlgX [Actinomyces ruminicola]SDM99081.1 glycogen operon protein [Actinomyces ruminicola]
MSSTPELQPAARADSAASDRTRLGATLVEDGADFVVVAPRAEAVDLCLLETDSTGAISSEARIGMHGPFRGAWSAHVPGVRAGQRYAYRVHGQWNPSEGLLFNPRKLLLDPYARAVDGAPRLGPELYAHAVDADLAPTYVPFIPSELDSAGHTALGVVTGEQFPVVPGPKVPEERTVIYETHVKGFTHSMPGVPPELRGTYAGLAHPAAVSHLRSLGVTTVELLPVHAAFSEAFLLQRERTNYWGYSTLSYFAPEPSYATRAAREAGPQAVLDEFRGMVSLLHEAGLEVIMDVVYNHTCESGMDGPALSLRGLDNLEYYLHAPHRPAQYVDVTGTGNTVDFRSTRAVQLVLDSLRYWAGDVGIDGFRFDLAVTLGRDASEFQSRHPLLIAMATDPVLQNAKLIAEPWDIGPGGWRTGEFPAPFHDWNDRYRGTVRSFWLHDASEMSKGRPGNDLRDLATRLSGSADMFGYGEYPGGRGPLASINFVTAHDGFTLRDLVCYDYKHNLANGEDNRDGTDDNRSWNHGFEGPLPEGMGGGPIEILRRRSSRNVLGTLLVSAGTPMLLGGDEMGRTQGGNNNSYCQDSEISWYDWNLTTWQRDLIATTHFLINLRDEHPVLRPMAFASGATPNGDALPDLSWFRANGDPMDVAAWHDPWTRVVQMLRSGTPMGDNDLLLVINGSLSQEDVTLPGGHGTDWHLMWDSTWAVPRPHTSAFALAHRVSRGPAARARALHPTRARASRSGATDCRQDRPGDTTTLDALSLRIYLSGEQLVGLPEEDLGVLAEA